MTWGVGLVVEFEPFDFAPADDPIVAERWQRVCFTCDRFVDVELHHDGTRVESHDCRPLTVEERHVLLDDVYGGEDEPDPETGR